MNDGRPDKSHLRRRRFLRFRLISLLLGVSLIAVVLVIWKHWQLRPVTAVMYLHLDHRAAATLSEPEGLSAERLGLFKEAQAALVRSPLVLERTLKSPGVAELPTLAKHSDKLAFLERHLSVRFAGDRLEIRFAAATDEPLELVRIVSAIGREYSVVSREAHEEQAKHLMALLEEERVARTRHVDRIKARALELARKEDDDPGAMADLDAVWRELADEEELLEQVERRLERIQAYAAGPVYLAGYTGQLEDD